MSTIGTYLLYLDSGEIVARIATDAASADQTARDHGAQLLAVKGHGASARTHHVVGGAAVPRPANPALLSGTTLSALPVPSTVTINGIAYTVDDGELEMIFPRAGTYAISVASPFPFLDASFTITT